MVAVRPPALVVLPAGTPYRLASIGTTHPHLQIVAPVAEGSTMRVTRVRMHVLEKASPL